MSWYLYAYSKFTLLFSTKFTLPRNHKLLVWALTLTVFLIILILYYNFQKIWYFLRFSQEYIFIGLIISTEPAEWFPVAQVQKQQWLAETVGCVHQFLSVLLQVVPR